VDYLGYIYEDPTVQQAIQRQKPFIVLDPKSKASACINQISSRLEKIEYREGSGVGEFLKRLFGRMQ
jgi:flagellar biosynthesis protein FlhG